METLPIVSDCFLDFVEGFPMIQCEVFRSQSFGKKLSIARLALDSPVLSIDWTSNACLTINQWGPDLNKEPAFDLGV